MPDKLRDALGATASLLLGLGAFFVFCGWTVLLPTNIAWLNFGDRAMHQLGWMFFRAAPWGMPPGSSPNLGIELANSIGLVDGLPLFALPLKLAAQWLPEPFQYWGYWLLLSFSLQSFFGYLIAREMGAGRLVSLAAAAFVLITPAFLFRVPMHLALSGHWVILAGLYLYVRRVPPRLYGWPLLLAVTSAIHVYLLVMVLALWLAALVQRLWLGRMRVVPAMLELVLGLAAAVAVLWTAGFFGVESIGSYGYGDYKLNLLWPLIRYAWSEVFPNIAHTRFDYEGLGFLGIGILALLVLAIASGAILRFRAVLTRAWAPLTVMLVLLMLFAFSNELHFADIRLITVQLPRGLEDIFATLRSTGRFVWPLLYVITIGTVVLVGTRFRAAIAVPLLAVAFAAQTVDSAPGWRPFALYMAAPASTWDVQLGSPFWERAVAAGFNRVRMIPVGNPSRDWKALGYFAVAHGMDTDAVYLGRIDRAALDALRASEAKVLATGNFEPRTIYELDARAALQAAQHLTGGDLLAVIDHRMIFVRSGAFLVAGLGIEPQPTLGD